MRTKSKHRHSKLDWKEQISLAQAQLTDAFMGKIEDKLDKNDDKSRAELKLSKRPETPVDKAMFAYNKFNDDEYETSGNEIKRILSNDIKAQKQVPADPTLIIDPNIKAELNKLNYSSLVELNRDYHFYLNHKEKIKKLNKLSMKRNIRKRPEKEEPIHGGNYDKENDFSIVAQSRDIMKSIEQSRAHGFMTAKERKKILKNLF
jgi:hypothetical protein